MFKFLAPPMDAVRLSTSWLFKANALGTIRAIISVYIFTTLITMLAYNSVHNHRQVARSWSYFTIITNWGLAFYFAFAALHSFTFWQKGAPILARWPRFLQQLHRLYYSTIVVFPLIVTIVFWGVIFDQFTSRYDTWSNISVHALNSVFALFEITFVRADPPPWIHLLYLIIFLALYLGVAYITVATEGFYVYSFLDDHNAGGRGRVAAYIFGILAGAIVVFILVKYLILLRRWLTERRGVSPEVLAHRGHGRGMSESRMIIEQKV